MSRSHSLVLALGLGQTYFFASTEGEWEFDDLPDSIDEALDPAVIKKVHWVSFGDSEDSWYLQYEDDQGLLRMK